MKEIEGFPGYFITEDGRVWSEARGVGRNMYGVWLSAGLNTWKYLQVSMKDENGKYKRKLVSRLVAQAYIPNPENKPTVNHKFGDKLDNRVGSLEWATHTEQSRHKFDVLGFEYTEETKAKIGAASKRRKCSAKTRKIFQQRAAKPGARDSRGRFAWAS
jgi:hypothetical protein